MLDNLRKQGASAFIWVVFAILIGMFVINFGQQSAGSTQGCNLGSGKRTALKVGRSSLDDTALRLAINLGQYFERGPSEVQTRRAMERLIRRELLAGEAERRGLRVSDGLVEHAITRGKVHYAGQVVDARGLFFSRLPAEDGTIDEDAPVDPADTYFDAKRFKIILRNMGISVGAYTREQKREVLASTMARIFLQEVPASREEALAQYIAENTRVSFNAVRFDANAYAEALRITDKDLERWVRANAAAASAAYVADAWKGKKQVHLRRIMVPKAPPPAAPNPTAQPAGGGTGPAPAPVAPPDPGQAKLEALRAQIVAGKRGFKEVAEELESNPSIAARGGDWGWYDEGVWTLPEPALNDAAAKLVQGKVSDVIEASDGYYLLIVDDRREGDLTFEQVQKELALPIARTAWGKEAARRAALAAFAEVKAKGKNLADLFPAEKTGMAPGPLTMVKDRPVSWGQAGDTTGSGSAAPAAAGAGSGPATSAGPTAADAGAPAIPPGPPSIMVPGTELLPQLGPVERPHVERHDGMVRAGDATPIGESAELVSALFDQLTVGNVGDLIFEVRASVIDPMPSYVLVQVTAKDLADVGEFEKQADRLVERLAQMRGYQLIDDWLRERCAAMAKDNKLKPTWAYLQTYDEQGRKEPITYQPCESMQPR
jgi:parvulin-like peptidyl-prolyl isomerase